MRPNYRLHVAGQTFPRRHRHDGLPIYPHRERRRHGRAGALEQAPSEKGPLQVRLHRYRRGTLFSTPDPRQPVCLPVLMSIRIRFPAHLVLHLIDIDEARHASPLQAVLGAFARSGSHKLVYDSK